MSSAQMLSRDVKSMAVALGADLVGICAARATPQSARLGAWLDRGYAGAMGYLARTRALREDPARLFEGARSMIVIGVAYDDGGDSMPPASAAPAAGYMALHLQQQEQFINDALTLNESNA